MSFSDRVWFTLLSVVRYAYKIKAKNGYDFVAFVYLLARGLTQARIINYWPEGERWLIAHIKALAHISQQNALGK